jgi:hypothetical protein
MSRRANGKVTVFWFLASAGLAGAIAVEMQNEPSLTPLAKAALTGSGGLAQPIDEAAASADWLSAAAIDEIVDRPLFSPSRRPYEPTVAAPVFTSVVVEDEPEEAATLDLIGTMLTGRSRIAMITHSDKGLLKMKRGDDVDGWRLVAISDEQVWLERDGETRHLGLRDDLETLRAQRRKTQARPAPAVEKKDEPAPKSAAPQSTLLEAAGAAAAAARAADKAGE